MFALGDLKKRILWMLFIVSIYTAGQSIVLPTVSVYYAQDYLNNVPFFSVIGITTGVQTRTPSIFMLGIGPCLTSMIIWQAIVAMDISNINNLSERTAGIIQNFISLIISITQSMFYVYMIRDSLHPVLWGSLNIDLGYFSAVLIMVSGGMFTIFLANVNTDRGIGGKVILMLPGVLQSLPLTLKNGWGGSVYSFSTTNIIMVVALVAIILPIIIALNQAELRIPIAIPSLTSELNNPYLPIRLLSASAMPFMFSATLFTLPKTLMNNGVFRYSKLGQYIMKFTDYSTPQGIFIYALIIIILNFSFGLMVFQPGREAKSMRKSNSYVYGVISGEQTEKFLLHKFIRLTCVGSGVLVLIGVVPLIMGLFVPSYANYSPFLGSLFILITIIDNIAQQFRAIYTKRLYRIL